MNSRKGMIAGVLCMVIGAAMMCAYGMDLANEFISGMGTVLMVVGAVRLVRLRRYQTDAAYKQRVDVEMNDERNRFISARAWAWAGYLYVIVGSIATIAMRAMGSDTLARASGITVMLLVLLYWGSYFVLRRKY